MELACRGVLVHSFIFIILFPSKKLTLSANRALVTVHYWLLLKVIDIELSDIISRW